MENKNSYETVIILRKENYNESLNKVKNYIENLTEIEKIEEVGLKRLAYEVKNQKTGYYVVIYFKSTVENIRELEGLYRIDENVLKFIVVRKDD